VFSIDKRHQNSPRQSFITTIGAASSSKFQDEDGQQQQKVDETPRETDKQADEMRKKTNPGLERGARRKQTQHEYFTGEWTQSIFKVSSNPSWQDIRLLSDKQNSYSYDARFHEATLGFMRQPWVS
jgi:hypothetical protein